MQLYKTHENIFYDNINTEIEAFFLKNKNIKVHIGDKIFEGIAKNIVEDGRIQIEMNGN